MDYNPCYMCGNVATTMEHAPPKSFFSSGHRKNLIRVPSCNKHNMEKSGDDEYLRLVLASAISANEFARQHIVPKILRSFEYSPKKVGLYRNLRPFEFGELKTGVFDADMERFNSVLEAMDRALFHHLHGYGWLERIYVVPPASFYVNYSDQKNNILRANLEIGFERHLGELPKYGDNPEIFYFQFHGKKDTGIMRKVFFGGVAILSAFNPHLLPTLAAGQ